MIATKKWILALLSRQLLQPKRLAIAEAGLIGLVSGLAAVLLGQGVSWLGGWRQHLAHILPLPMVLPLFGFGGGYLAGWIVEHFAPTASGSGMSEVKAVLARVPMPLNLRIAIVKLIGSILVLGAGMPLGREGPTVQIGAALAAQLSRWVPTSPDHRRQLLAAGAGAGLAAAFNAPIAGVLFVIEELLQDVSGITLGTAILASFIAAVVSRIYGTHSLDLNLHLVTPNTSFSAPEIPFYLLLGIIAGSFGVLFNQGILTSLNFYRRFLNIGLPWRVGVAGLATGVVLVLLPEFRDNAGLRELLLTGDANWQLVAMIFVVQILLILFTYGSGAPGGLLVPSLVLGAALGYLVGTCEHTLLGLGTVTTYSRVGMAAFFCAVARVPITAVIIVFEMTTDFNLVLPLMIVSVVAYLVADKVATGSLYDRLLAWKGIHLEKQLGDDRLWTLFTAAEVMQPKVETLSSQISLDEAIQAFSDSSHRNFPVIDHGKLVGILTQKDIAAWTQRRSEQSITVAQMMTPEPVTTRPNDTLAHVLHLLNYYRFSALPVAEGTKLLGIITRSDIIRIEAEHLNGRTGQPAAKSDPSYLVYRTQSPQIGRGRLLVPICNPKTIPALLKMAVAIAHDRNYEIECLQVILISPNQLPSETVVRTQNSQKLLQQAVVLGQAWRVPVHTQIRVAHTVSGAILETIKDRHIDLVLMGWKGSTATPGRVFSQVVDTVIRQSPCEVVLAKLPNETRFDRWLVPMAGGPNAQQAIQLLPALSVLSRKPEVKLCQVFQPEQTPNTELLEKTAKYLEPQLHGTVKIAPVSATSVSEAIIQFSQQEDSDVIMVGASRERLLQQVMNGNVPEEIARNSDCTVILVRGAVA
ncbi:chloride channel protein [Pantanalinema sp. GBBB05]|uniref:chloride channel protein n=1 Tax=Pantanalinema sp. GBBB05 TaxID=2604139 RepID=UPI001D25B27B|nr:CBS domain-containing protein [Pantanalinema sp. GBBB05]